MGLNPGKKQSLNLFSLITPVFESAEMKLSRQIAFPYLGHENFTLPVS